MCQSCQCCCNTFNKKCYLFGIIFSCIFILVFQIMVVALTENSIEPEDVKSFIFRETPMYDLEIKETDLTSKKNVTFFEYAGRKQRVGDTITIYDEKSFTKILRNKFLYDGKDKNYLDYKNDYSVESGNNCPQNYKKCGILDSNNRILCLPNDEDCPLNGIGISTTNNDPKYNTYNKKEVIDSQTSSTYYIYYTNNNYEGKIITEFKLSHGSPCAKSSEKNWISFYSNEVEQEYSCQTSIDGSIYSDRYTKVTDTGISMQGLYHDNGLYESPQNSEATSATIDLYVRNYNQMDEKCFKDFIKDLEDEEKYYDSIVKIIRALGTISLIVNALIFFYCCYMCCRDVKFYSVAIIVPIYGIVCNSIILGILNKEKIKYKCQLEGFNDSIDEKLDEQYENSNLTATVMSAISLAFYILMFFFSLCLKFMKSRAGFGKTMVMTPVVPVPVYPQVYPTPYNTNIAYPNMMVPPNSY